MPAGPAKEVKASQWKIAKPKVADAKAALDKAPAE
jgi:hypothetical protein